MAYGRHMTRHARVALLASAAFAALPGLAWAQAGGTVLQDIVVTAQKREENLQTVPVAVTALTSDALETIRFTNAKDLNAAAPGLTVRASGGGIQQPVFTMRGVYATSTFASNPAVAVYMDGVYISNTVGAQFDLADVERIEVLRGPQGTLFGRNAIAGAVNVITREPSGKFSAREEASVGNLGQFRSRTTVNLPGWGPLSASVTYLHDKADGDIKNIGAGTVWHYAQATNGLIGDRVSPKTLGGHKTDAVAAAVALRPGADIKAIYRFNYTHQEFVPDGAGPGTFDTSLGFLFQPLWAAQNPATRSPLTFRRPKAVNNWYTTPGLLKNRTHSLTITAPVTDSVSLKSLTAFRNMSVNTTNQLDGLGGILVAANTPLLAIVNATQSHQKSFQQELQANIDTHWLKSTIGLLHYKGKVTEGPFPGTLNAPFGSGFGFSPAYVNFTAPSVPTLDSTLTTKSDAAYTQNEIHIFPGLDLVGGARVTKDRRDGIDNSTVPASAGTNVRYRKTTWTYLVGVNYKLSEDVFTYVKYSTAYISGGQLANHKFDPATAKSLEAGVKADLLQHRLRANLAVFNVKYGQFQILTNPRAGCNFPGVPISAPQCIVNGGDARDRGFELELTYVPVQGLTLEGSTAYNDMKFTRVDPLLRNPVDGSFVTPQSPKWTASAAATYRGADMDGFRGAHIVGRAEVLYTTSAYAQAQSMRIVLQETKIPSKAIVNGRIGVAGMDVGGAEVEVAAFARNLFNSHALAFAADLAADVGATWERARAYGVDVKVAF